MFQKPQYLIASASFNGGNLRFHLADGVIIAHGRGALPNGDAVWPRTR
jgi:hypothetical protein